jgi:hypothetical protein
LREVSTVTTTTHDTKDHYYTPQLLQTSRHSTTRYQKSDFSSGRPHDFNDSSLRMFTTTTTPIIISFTQRPCCLYCCYDTITSRSDVMVCTTSLFFPALRAQPPAHDLYYCAAFWEERIFHSASCLVPCNTYNLFVFMLLFSRFHGRRMGVDSGWEQG